MILVNKEGIIHAGKDLVDAMTGPYISHGSITIAFGKPGAFSCVRHYPWNSTLDIVTTERAIRKESISCKATVVQFISQAGEK